MAAPFKGKRGQEWKGKGWKGEKMAAPFKGEKVKGWKSEKMAAAFKREKVVAPINMLPI